MSVDAVATERLRECLVEYHRGDPDGRWTLAQVGRMAGLSEGYVSKLASGHRGWSGRKASVLLAWLGLSRTVAVAGAVPRNPQSTEGTE